MGGTHCYSSVTIYGHILAQVRIETCEMGLVNRLLDLYKALREEPEFVNGYIYGRTGYLGRLGNIMVDDRMCLCCILLPEADLSV